MAERRGGSRPKRAWESDRRPEPVQPPSKGVISRRCCRSPRNRTPSLNRRRNRRSSALVLERGLGVRSAGFGLGRRCVGVRNRATAVGRRCPMLVLGRLCGLPRLGFVPSLRVLGHPPAAVRRRRRGGSDARAALAAARRSVRSRSPSQPDRPIRRSRPRLRRLAHTRADACATLVPRDRREPLGGITRLGRRCPRLRSPGLGRWRTRAGATPFDPRRFGHTASAAAPSACRSRTKSASNARPGAKLNSSSSRQSRRTCSAASSAPAMRSTDASSRSESRRS